MPKRVVAVFAVLALVLMGLVVRIGYLGAGSGLASAARQQSGLTMTVARQRGTIYDRHQLPLVNAQADYRACVAPYATALGELTAQLSSEEKQTLVTRLQAGKPAVIAVGGLLNPAHGLLQFIARARYADRQLAPHLIGYLDSDNLHGVTGIEAAFDEQLVAASGTLTVSYAVDGNGVPLAGAEPTVTDTLDDSRAGVVLTLDRDIQKLTEDAAEALVRGAAVVMEPDTGRILALVSVPTYQPGTVAQQLEDKNAPLLNRALSNYNCGSVFKIVSAAAALESGASPDTVFSCSGGTKIGDTVFHCHNKLGHGALTMQEAFGVSCNSYFIQLIASLGAAPLYRMAESLDFNRSLTLAGSVRTAHAVLPTQAELMAPAELANLSFGQGSLLASPVHIAQMLTAVCGNGELHKATVLQGTVAANGTYTEEPLAPTQAAFSATTAATLRRFMMYTVQSGSGASALPAAGGAGGKTGTAETGWTKNGAAVVQSWFAGFYPAEQPAYIVVVLAEDKNNTGVTAAPVFREICNRLAAMP